MSVTRIPQIYQLGGGPLRWQDDMSGALPAAVMNFLRDRASDYQVELVREYLEYYIKAPIWDNNPFLDDEAEKQLSQVREEITRADDAADIHAWIHDCLEIGIDPL